MSVDLDSRDTAGRKAPLSLTADILKNACAADALFRERYDLSTWLELGRGAFAGVARIYCRDRAEEVAVKVFYCLTEESRARMRAEVANAQRAYSELLVRVHTPFSSGDLAWIEMELVHGRNLDQEIARRKAAGNPFDVGEGLELGIAIAEALDAAHRAGVIHRDLKPANLLLPESGKPRIKLGDFGISKFLEAAKLTATGEIPGTPQYAAPEVWEAKGVSSAADVYSLGLVLFRILTTGAYAYDLPDGASTPQVFVAHKQQTPRRIRRLNPEVPEGIENLILRMLAKVPNARPALYVVLPALSAARASLAAPPVPASARRGRVALALASSAGALLLVAITWIGRRPVQEPDASGLSPSLLGPGATANSSLASPLAPPVQAPIPEPRPTEQPKRAVGAHSPSATPVPRSAFQVTIEGPAVAVTNVSGKSASELTVTLVSSDGSRHTALLDAVGPGEVVLVPFGEFKPELPDNSTVVRAEVQKGAAGTRQPLVVSLRD